MRDYTAFWSQDDGKDGTAALEGNTTYDGEDGAQQPFETLIGTAHLFYDPKTDWTAKDAINAEDFNAIEINTATAAWYLRLVQYAIPELATVTGRTKKSFDFLASINRLEANLETIRVNFATPPGYPGTSTWGVGDGFDWRDANRLERDVQLLFETAQKVFESFFYCGELSCGEEGEL